MGGTRVQPAMGGEHARGGGGGVRRRDARWRRGGAPVPAPQRRRAAQLVDEMQIGVLEQPLRRLLRLPLVTHGRQLRAEHVRRRAVASQLETQPAAQPARLLLERGVGRTQRRCLGHQPHLARAPPHVAASVPFGHSGRRLDARLAQLLLKAAHLARHRLRVRLRVRLRLRVGSALEAPHRVAPFHLGHRHLLVRRGLSKACLRLRPRLLLLRALRHLGARVAQLGHELSGVALHLLLGRVELDHLARELRSLSLGGVPRLAQLELLLAQYRARRRQLVARLAKLRLRVRARFWVWAGGWGEGESQIVGACSASASATATATAACVGSSCERSSSAPMRFAEE